MLEHKRYSEKRHKKELKRRKLRAYKKKVLPEIYQREREARRKTVLRTKPKTTFKASYSAQVGQLPMERGTVVTEETKPFLGRIGGFIKSLFS
jgi:hypothetical protein